MLKKALLFSTLLAPVFGAEAQTQADQQPRCPALAGSELEQVQGWNEKIRAYYCSSTQKKPERAEYLQTLFDYQGYLLKKVATIAPLNSAGMEGTMSEAACRAQQEQLQRITDLIAVEKRLTPKDPAFKGRKIDFDTAPAFSVTPPEAGSVNVPCTDPAGAELEQVREWNTAILNYRCNIGDKTPVMREKYINALFDYSDYLFEKLSAVGVTRDTDRAGLEQAEQSCTAQQTRLKEVQELLAAEKTRCGVSVKPAANPFALDLPQHRQ